MDLLRLVFVCSVFMVKIWILSGAQDTPANTTNGKKDTKITDKPKPKEPVAREGIHLSIGHDPFVDRVFMWTSTLPKDYLTVTSDTKDYSRNISVTGVPIKDNYEKHYIFRFELRGLLPNKGYSYVIGDSGKSYRFYTWEHESPRFPEEFLLYSGRVDHTSHVKLSSDVKLSSVHLPSERLISETKLNRYFGILNLGDWSCSQHTKEFLAYIEEFSARIPFLPVPGKKDMENDFSFFGQLFSLPYTKWPSNKYWYSFDTDYAHFISFTSELYFMKTSMMVQHLIAAQYNWLVNDLKKITKKYETDGTRPWIIMFSHRPLYCSGDLACVRDGEKLKLITELFHQYSVDLVITAQNHFYERTFPVYQNIRISEDYAHPEATVYLTTAAFSCGAGNDSAHVISGLQPEWSNVRKKTKDVTYSRLAIYNKTHLKLEERDATTHVMIDTFWLQHHHRSPFPPKHHISPWIVVIVVFLLLLTSAAIIIYIKRGKIAEYISKRKQRKSQTYVNLPEGSFDL